MRTVGLDAEQIFQVTSEVENQLVMDHPNICRLLEVFEEPGKLSLVMERMRGSDLLTHLKKAKRYTERDAANCVKQMAAAVAYCHRNGVCHRDLKLENFCLEDQTATARVKLIDFGLSSVYDSSVPMTNACGTLHYVAPEVIGQSYDKKCDMWSLGVIAYILLSGEAPFTGRNDASTLRRIREGTYLFGAQRWGHISDLAKDFVSKLLQVDVGLRLDAESALAHPWLAKVIGEEDLEPFDAEVLQSLRSFSRSNPLKRAVLRAVAPVATAERVATWVDHFEALRKDSDGKVAIKDLARRLMECGGLSKTEAVQLSAALAESDECGDRVSYSGFLAACLSAHVALDDQHLRCLFDRLGAKQTGTVSAADVCHALGDVVDIADLTAELEGKPLTYSDFRWLMSMPNHGPTVLGLRHLLGACSSVAVSWKLSCHAKKSTDEAQAMQATRRENMAWRVWFKKAQTAKLEEQMQRRPSHVALSLESWLVSRGRRTRAQLTFLSQEEVRSIVAEELEARGLGVAAELEQKPDEELAELCWRAGRREAGHVARSRGAGHSGMARTPTMFLVESDDDARLAWHYAVVAAKDGCVEAARRENMGWRKMHVRRSRMA